MLVRNPAPGSFPPQYSGSPSSLRIYTLTRQLILPLVGVAEELTSEDNVLIAVGKVPSNDCWILAAADDPPGIELQLEDTRVGAVAVGV
jgi:hypothetical protein